MKTEVVTMSTPAIATRDSFGAWFTRMGWKTGVEVGVQRGLFSETILRTWKGKLYCVDIWRHIEGWRDVANVTDAEMEVILAEAKARLEPLGAVMVRKSSLEAAEDFAESSVDWVYLDADHTERAVRADLNAWWGKVRSGGVMAGHDYFDDSNNPCGEFGVKSAVDNFFGPMGLCIWETSEEYCRSWYVWKI